MTIENQPLLFQSGSTESVSITQKLARRDSFSTVIRKSITDAAPEKKATGLQALFDPKDILSVLSPKRLFISTATTLNPFSTWNPQSRLGLMSKSALFGTTEYVLLASGVRTAGALAGVSANLGVALLGASMLLGSFFVPSSHHAISEKMHNKALSYMNQGIKGGIMTGVTGLLLNPLRVLSSMAGVVLNPILHVDVTVKIDNAVSDRLITLNKAVEKGLSKLPPAAGRAPSKITRPELMSRALDIFSVFSGAMNMASSVSINLTSSG